MSEVESIAGADLDDLPGEPGQHPPSLIGHTPRLGGHGLLGVQTSAQRMAHPYRAAHCRDTGRSGSGQARRHGSRAARFDNKVFNAFIECLLDSTEIYHNIRYDSR